MNRIIGIVVFGTRNNTQKRLTCRSVEFRLNIKENYTEYCVIREKENRRIKKNNCFFWLHQINFKLTGRGQYISQES